MTAGRWILLAAIVVAALLVSFNFYYRYVQSPVWAAQATAESDAEQKSGLKKITEFRIPMCGMSQDMGRERQR